MPLTKNEKIYLAGIVDGEGSICLVRSNSRASSKYVYPTLRVANTEKILIDWITNRIEGGSIYTLRNVYHWACAGSLAIDIIKQIHHYLVIKAYQAELVLALDAENRAYKKKYGYFGNKHLIPKDLEEFRNMSFDFMQKLHRREVNLYAFR